MSFFDLFKKKEKNTVDKEATAINDIVFDIYSTICKKCEYGDAIEKLNEYERIFYVVQLLETEVNNGGFAQYFFNSAGDFANELIDALTKIEAFKTVEICKKALLIYDGKVPTDKEKREEVLLNLDCDDILSECDDAFYSYEDNLKALNHAFIMRCRNFFD